MILDNEEQRSILIGIIDATNINANLQQAIQMCNMVLKIRNEVEAATIAVPETKE